GDDDLGDLRPRRPQAFLRADGAGIRHKAVGRNSGRWAAYCAATCSRRNTAFGLLRPTSHLTLRLNLKRDILTVGPSKQRDTPLSTGTQLCWTVPVPPTHRPEKPRPPHEPGPFLSPIRHQASGISKNS